MMNKRILALSLLAIPVVFYILQYNGIVPAICIWVSLVAVLLINLWILSSANRDGADQ